MELLPAIDLRSGRVVRLRQGDDARRTVYETDPRDALAAFAEAGVTRVHCVDLDAALGEGAQRELLAQMARRAAELGLGIQLGGGLRRAEDFEWWFGAGGERAVVSSILARDFPLFAELATRFAGRMVPALDQKEGRLGIAGWRQTAELSVEELAGRLKGLPCAAVLVTDISRDGEMGGANLELTRDMGRRTGLPALLSGGVRDLDDLRRARDCPEIGGAVVGKALWDGRFTVAEALAVCRGDGA